MCRVISTFASRAMCHDIRRFVRHNACRHVPSHPQLAGEKRAQGWLEWLKDDAKMMLVRRKALRKCGDKKLTKHRLRSKPVLIDPDAAGCKTN